MAEGIDTVARRDTAPPAGITLKGAIAATVAVILAGVYAVEGGYVNDARDPGGATSYGVTEQVARQYGYHGDMRGLNIAMGPRQLVPTPSMSGVHRRPGYMPLVQIEPADFAADHTAVNMAVTTQPLVPTDDERAGDAPADSMSSLGPADVATYRMLRARLGVILPASRRSTRSMPGTRRNTAWPPPAPNCAPFKGWLRSGSARGRRSCGRFG